MRPCSQTPTQSSSGVKSYTYYRVEEEEEIDKDFEKSLVEYSVIWITSALYPYDKIMIT